MDDEYKKAVMNITTGSVLEYFKARDTTDNNGEAMKDLFKSPSKDPHKNKADEDGGVSHDEYEKAVMRTTTDSAQCFYKPSGTIEKCNEAMKGFFKFLTLRVSPSAHPQAMIRRVEMIGEA